jgi:hypothetical protein
MLGPSLTSDVTIGMAKKYLLDAVAAHSKVDLAELQSKSPEQLLLMIDPEQAWAVTSNVLARMGLSTGMIETLEKQLRQNPVDMNTLLMVAKGLGSLDPMYAHQLLTDLNFATLQSLFTNYGPVLKVVYKVLSSGGSLTALADLI